MTVITVHQLTLATVPVATPIPGCAGRNPIPDVIPDTGSLTIIPTKHTLIDSVFNKVRGEITGGHNYRAGVLVIS